MAYIPPDTIAQLKQIDLLTYLQTYEPEELVCIGGEYTTKTHSSLRISNGIWHWHSQGKAGTTALQYLVDVKGMTFLEAANLLAGQTAARLPVFMSENTLAQRKAFVLPKTNSNNHRVISYLSGRGIDAQLIDHCIQNGLLYESTQYHNCVFVGRDFKDIPRYAALRGTGDSRFMGEVSGSDKRHSFSLCPAGSSERLQLFESAIDLLSYCTLQKIKGRDWQQGSYLSLGGVTATGKDKMPAALSAYLERKPDTQCIYFHLDNDYAGRAATAAIRATLPEQIQAFNAPPTFGKDVNDTLRHYLGESKYQQKGAVR